MLKLRHNIEIWPDQIFDILPSFCVTWLWSWQKRHLRRVDRQSRTGLICCSSISINVNTSVNISTLLGFVSTATKSGHVCKQTAGVVGIGFLQVACSSQHLINSRWTRRQRVMKMSSPPTFCEGSVGFTFLLPTRSCASAVLAFIACPSVCPSVTSRYCIKTAKHRISKHNALRLPRN